MNNERIKLIIEPISKRILINKGSTVYEALMAWNFPMGALCAGNGTCGKCLIRILDKNPQISDPSEKEETILGKQKLLDGFRLACQTKLHGDLRVLLSGSLVLRGIKILADAGLEVLGIKHENLQPAITAQVCQISQGNLIYPRDDLSGLFEGISDEIDFDENDDKFCVDDVLHSISLKLPLILRKEEGIITAYFRKLQVKGRKKIYDVDAGDKTRDIHGLAIDIGTTTIVGYLIHLKTGEISAISSLLNPQVGIGEDVITRISYIVKNEAIQRAKSLVIDAINHILEDCCIKAKISISSVKDIAIVGNTVMHHIFFGITPEFLSISPYTPAFKAPINVSTGKLGIKCNPSVNVYSPPIISGYVGTDTIGCVISSQIYTSMKYSLLIDIGTNGELVLGNDKGLITASCAAGSALEGAHISYGMRASEGAIETVAIDKETLDPTIGVIGNSTPIGLCGSGLIDIIAEMLRAEIITRTGKFNIKSKKIMKNRRIIKKQDGYHYIIFKKEWDYEQVQIAENEKIEEILISQKDVHKLQLAKGAFLSAANILLKKDNNNDRNLEQIILAGGFGTYINKANAAFIGLFPEIKQDNIVQIGNAAGIGAQLFIKDIDQRTIANEIAHRIQYKELASLPSFQREFTFSLYFPHYNLERFPLIRQEYNEIM